MLSTTFFEEKQTMLSPTFLRWLKLHPGSSSRSRTRPHRAAQRPAFVPRLLMLEDRLCPSWSTPVNLGPMINLPGSSQIQVAISPDQLSLYFTSGRPGGFGASDIWVSHRESMNDPWGDPQNLGPNINSPQAEFGPDFSPDGHWLYFESLRPGGFGGGDIWASYRADPHDDFGWEPAVNLGPGVNGPYDDADPSIFVDPQTGVTTLYFASFGRPEGQGDWDIYASTLKADGTFGPAVPVTELNTPDRETHPSVSRDGLTLYFTSTRPGSVGGLDIWESTRATTHDRWSSPVNLGSPIDTAFDDRSPYLSDDGNALFFSSNRPGGFATFDIYMSTYIDIYTVVNLNDSGPGSLRQAIIDANAHHGHDTIRFDPGLHGTITLTGGQLNITDDLTIEGPGANTLAVSGNHASRIFNISGGVTVTIAGLTITDGLAAGGPGQGGGILNTGSNLTVAHDVLSNNEALGNSGNGNGAAGAIESTAGATLNVTHSLFLHNQAIGNNTALGGAIECTGSATVSDSTFIGNLAHGGDSGTSGFTRGGAIYNSLGVLTVANSTLTGNQAIGGSNNTGSGSIGQVIGGGIANTDRAILFVTASIFSGNQALGGSNNTSTGGTGNVGIGTGGGLFNVGVATVTDSLFEDNEARGGSGNTGNGAGFQLVGTASGGGISTSANNTSGTPALLTLSNVTLRNNHAVGGDGNTAGTFSGIGQGGGLVNSGAKVSGPSGGSTATLSNCLITDNQAIGGQGAPGGEGREGVGGGLGNILGATLTVSGSTLTGNQAVGGAGESVGNGGSGFGGGIFNDVPSTHPSNPGAPTSLTVLGSTLTGNEATGGAAGAGGTKAGLGAGGGIASAGILTVLGSGLSHNWALGRDGAGGANGGDGLGGGLYIAGGTASVLTTTTTHNRAFGGAGDAGGNGGNGFGGGVYVGAGTVVVSASDISDNQAVGGLGGDGATDGLGVGGGVYNLGTFLFDAATVIRHNRASDSNDDCFGC
jgi:hypothetical protein